MSGPLTPDDSELTVEVERDPGRHVLALSGELDLTAAGRLLDTVAASCSEDISELVIDLSALVFLDSSGLRAILDSATLCEEHMCEFRLRPSREDVPPQVRRLLQITGLIERLPFAPGEKPESQQPAGESGAA